MVSFLKFQRSVRVCFRPIFNKNLYISRCFDKKIGHLSFGRKKVSPQTFLVCESTLLLHPELCFSTIKVESPKIPIGLKKPEGIPKKRCRGFQLDQKKKVQGFQGFQKGFQRKVQRITIGFQKKQFRDSKDSRDSTFRDSKDSRDSTAKKKPILGISAALEYVAFSKRFSSFFNLF